MHPKEREAWELVGEKIDSLSRTVAIRSSWLDAKVWGPLLVQTIIGILMLGILWQQVQTLRAEMVDTRTRLYGHLLGDDSMHPHSGAIGSEKGGR